MLVSKAKIAAMNWPQGIFILATADSWVSNRLVFSQSLLPSKRGIPQLLGKWTRPEQNHAWLNTRPLESRSPQQLF